MPLLDHQALPQIPSDTRLTDRQLLIHAMAHIEDMHEQILEMRAEQQQFVALLEEFAPVLDRFRNRGRLPFGRPS